MNKDGEQSMSLVKIEGLKKTFETEAEELLILKDINLEITENTTAVITGESGCGKSTLMNIIGGLEKPDTGILTVGGISLPEMGEAELSEYRKRKIGFIFQFHYLMKDFTCIENVLMPYFMAGSRKKEAAEKAAAILERVKLDHRMNHYPAQMSGGERQRAALARALINDPQIILADEPTGNLDEENSKIVEKLLFDLVESFGKTLLMVTHDKSLAGRGDIEYQLSKGELHSK